MKWFGKKQEKRLAVAKTANIEIAVAKEATEKATEQALKDAEQVKELLERNHFSVTLYIAVGGRVDQSHNRGKHA